MRYSVILVLALFCCQQKDQARIQQEIGSLNLNRGDIALCGSENAILGKVNFNLSCAENVRADFNMGIALLHSFEYAEAEKVFAKVIDADPECLMAYWGAAMSNFHPLWAPPTKEELNKGSGLVRLARTLKKSSSREADYLETVATLFDNWENLSHRERLLKFEQASEKNYFKFPGDKEAAIFYALALRAAADPTDKTFLKQKKAGDILNSLFPNEPDHPGVAHYLIHTYDYPELAELALPAARKYASIAATSAHALHMPSHIFTRLGLWEESITSNMNSITAAKCYAENSGLKGHWDEELHGIDYLVYAYLQLGNDTKAEEQVEIINGVEQVFPVNNKIAYTFAAVPTRFALERKDWKAATELSLNRSLQWEKFPWERSIISFGKVLGAVHLGDMNAATTALNDLKANHEELVGKNDYEANQVLIQVKAAEAWIQFLKGNKGEAIKLMIESADMEDATEKHPITPGEVLPARELLGDLLMELKEYDKAVVAYEADLKRHTGRLNGLRGAVGAAEKAGQKDKVMEYRKKIEMITRNSERDLPKVKPML